MVPGGPHLYLRVCAAGAVHNVGDHGRHLRHSDGEGSQNAQPFRHPVQPAAGTPLNKQQILPLES